MNMGTSTIARTDLQQIDKPLLTGKAKIPTELLSPSLTGKNWLEAIPRQLRELRVLLVEPNANELKVLAQQLTACGIKLDTAVDGFAALRRAAVRVPDVVVTPMNSEVMGGQQLAEQLRRDYSNLQMLIIGIGSSAQTHRQKTTVKPAIDLHLPSNVTSEIVETLVLLEWNRLDRLHESLRPCVSMGPEKSSGQRHLRQRARSLPFPSFDQMSWRQV